MSSSNNSSSQTIVKQLYSYSEKAGELLGSISAAAVKHSSTIISKGSEMAKQTRDTAMPIIKNGTNTISNKAKEVIPEKYHNYFSKEK
tara:strand:+ start:3174 stop:3437 length:264 start_codon:yes stop_codon:yes gene_type:complete